MIERAAAAVGGSTTGFEPRLRTMSTAEAPPHTDRDAPPVLRAVKRLPPHDLAAEEAVIGSALINPQVAVEVVALVGPDDFYKPLHAAMWAHAVDMVAELGYVDHVVLVDRLAADGIDRGEAAEAMLKAQADVPASSRARVYAGIVAGHALSRRQIMAAGAFTEAIYKGDQIGAARARALLAEIADTTGGSQVGRALKNANLVDWTELWQHESATEEWVAWPLVPKGRGVALWAPAKAGKSTIVLAVVAPVAAGLPILGRPNANRPVNVLYLDYEMTLDDLRERLEEFGYGPGTDFSHLHYALLPSLPPLNTPEGAAELLALAKSCGAELVVIDTFSRANGGSDENDATTTQAFYNHTGKLLKREGIAYLRTDHAGKDVERGQRGSSAKNDDVDVVWQLSRGDEGVTLKRTHSRIPWVTESLPILRVVGSETITYEVAGSAVWPTGTVELAGKMDQIHLPLTASKEAARHAGIKARNTLISAALRYRREALLTLKSVPGTVSGGSLGLADGSGDSHGF